jgi:HK97 family phage major capsid protein
MSSSPVDATFLRHRKARIRDNAEQMLLDARAAGRDVLNPAEAAAYTGALESMRAIDDDLERCAAINTNPTLRRLGGDATTRTGKRTTMTTVLSEPLTYRAHDHAHSWVRDLVRHQTGRDDDGEARNRLMRHAQDVATEPAYTEYRDISRVDGSGGYAVPPAWLMDQYIELARPGRAFANLCQNLPLPGGTDSINIPKLLTGTSTAIQTADNTTISETDLTDTFINAPVRTIAGQQSLSIQLIDQSPIAFDEVVFKDLIADYAAKLDLQCLYGTGASGQVLGVAGTPGITTITVSAATIQAIYSAIANAIQTILSTRYQPPNVLVMHPRRWAWLLTLLDLNDRPLFLPDANRPFNAAGVLQDVDLQQVVGSVQGLPIVTDPNITATGGSGGTDSIWVLRASDLLLWQSGVRSRVLPETRASTLSVLLQCFGYLAFSAGRYPQSVVELVGLPQPTF